MSEFSSQNEQNASKFCRTCLKFLEDDGAHDLFGGNGSDFVNILQCLTAASIEPNDGLPQKLCNNCYDKLLDFVQFGQMCLKSMQKFSCLEQLATKEVQQQQCELLDSGLQHFAELEQHADTSFVDPLLNSRLELIDSENVIKMLEHVNKEIAAQPRDAAESEQAQDFFSEIENYSSEESLLMEMMTENDADKCTDYDAYIPNEQTSEEDEPDDMPLAKRKTKRSRQTSKLQQKRKGKQANQSESQVECHICHAKFKKNESYNRHMKYHNAELPHQCSVEACQKGFSTASGLRLHIDHCHPELIQNIACPEAGCEQTFPRSRLLGWHMRKVHNKSINASDRRYACSECEKVFKCPLALKKHSYKHDGKELPFPCNICGKRFLLNSALKEHLMRHAGIKNYICPFCGVGKTTRQEWNKHLNTHTQEKKFKCDLCPHASHNKQSLSMHIKVVHEKIKDFACQFCGKTFGKAHACKMHEMTHTGEKQFECKVCAKRFLYSKSLTKHLKTHEKRVLRAIAIYRKKQVERGEHVDESNELTIPDIPMPPNVDKTAPTMAAADILKVCAESIVHVSKDPRRVQRVELKDLAGTAVNPIPAVAVPSWSPQINYMLKEGPHVCPECGQGFNGAGNMKRHHRIVHEGVKDFACRYCPKRFGKPDTLKHHEMTHTGEKPHACTECDRRFIQVVALKRHMKVHFPKPPVIPASVYESRAELQFQQNAKIEAERKANAEREAIAAAAKKRIG